MLPGGGELNGRRWQVIMLRAWACFAGASALALAHADPQSLFGLRPWLDESGFKGQLKTIGLVHPQPFREWGGLFLWIHRLVAGPSGVRPLELILFIDRSDPCFDANGPWLYSNYSRNLFSPGMPWSVQFGWAGRSQQVLDLGNSSCWIV